MAVQRKLSSDIDELLAFVRSAKKGSEESFGLSPDSTTIQRTEMNELLKSTTATTEVLKGLTITVGKLVDVVYGTEGCDGLNTKVSNNSRILKVVVWVGGIIFTLLAGFGANAVWNIVMAHPEVVIK